MATLMPLRAADLFRFNAINLDRFTETYSFSYYLTYLAHWPEYCHKAVSPDGAVLGYIIGKAEGQGTDWHGHVTALTVSPAARRLGLASKLMDVLEAQSALDDAYFVDLFVRLSNRAAITFYEGLGFVTYRRVRSYYTDEDALDMRKALPRDVDKRSLVCSKPVCDPEDL